VPEQAECPFCGQTKHRLLRVVEAEESATHFIRREHNAELHRELAAIISGLWNAESCRWLRCEGCEGEFCWPHVGGDAQFYNVAYRLHFGYPESRWEFGAALPWAPTQADPHGRVLELGAGKGAFVRLLLAKGCPANQIFAIEYSDRARAMISEIDPALTVLAALEDAKSHCDRTGVAFTHICGFQVLEHIGRPLSMLNALHDLLAPSGVICLSVPNPPRVAFNEEHGLLIDMPPNHVSLFCVKAMAALARRAGLELEHAEAAPYAAGESFREFLAFHYKRRTHTPGSIQNWVEANAPLMLARATGGVLALPSAIRSMPGRTDGPSLFFVLRKPQQAGASRASEL
jgi:SAM-dependent methyltransferase